jgi:nicotinamide-nucleotide adenylyltransferase
VSISIVHQTSPRTMTDQSTMASRLSMYRSLAPQMATALKAFQSSGSKFRILKTIRPSDLVPKDPSPAAAVTESSPKTLFILDSSFNPPSIAHQTLTQTALHTSTSSNFSKPHRMLLLFATMNADKAPSAAPFHQRLTLMVILAVDLLEAIREKTGEYSAVPVDIGVTTVPYYTEKTAAIESEGREWYPNQPRHIHLVGYDTLTRFFASKYYKDFDPPFSALNPYFDDGHRLRVTLRPDDAFGTIAEQKAFLKRLENGEMEAEGGKREWAQLVELVDPSPKAGVSSTRIRRAANAGDWDVVGELCTDGVAEYVKAEGLYAEDARGAKMA